MLDHILLALWFFIPAGVANVTPIFAARIPGIRRFSVPMDGGAHFRGRRIFGAHKTWRGLLTGVLLATATLWVQQQLVIHSSWLQSFTGTVDYPQINVVLLGVLFGVGALGGDAIESFFKRQINLRPGQSWFPFDQIDYIIGGAIATGFVAPLSLIDYVCVVVLWTAIHLFSSWLGYHMHVKERPL